MKKEHDVIKFLRRIKDLDIKAPEIFVEDGGEISLDWHLETRLVLTLTFPNDNTIGWAGLINTSPFHGHELFDEAMLEVTEKLIKMHETYYNKMRLYVNT